METGRSQGTVSLSRATSRREFLARGGSAVAGLSLLGLSACGGGGGGGGDGGGGGKLIFSTSPDTEEIVKKQIPRFTAGGASASLRIGPADTGQYFDQLRTQFQAGGGDIDVISGDIVWPPQFAANDWIVDLSERFTPEERKKYLPGAIEGNTYQDKIWGVPWFTDAGLLYYRTDLLEKSGYSKPPDTWDELKAMASKVRRDSGIANGFVFTGAQYEGGTVLGLEFIRTAGGDVLDGDRVVIASPEAIRGLTIEQSLVADGITPEAAANFKEDEAISAFLRGDAVFMRMWPFAYDMLSDKEASKLDKSQVGLAQVPVAAPEIPRTNVGGGWNFFINAGTGDEEAAWELVKFMSAPEQQKQMALQGSYLPTRLALYEDREIIDALPAIALGKDAVKNTSTPPVSPYYSDMSLAMAEQFNANVLGKAQPEEVAQTLESKLQSIVSRG